MKFRFLLLPIFLFLFFFSFNPPVHAQLPGPAGAVVNAVGQAASGVGIFDDIQDFCKTRQGNTVNLETWYSGKCPNDSLLQNITGVGQQSGLFQKGEYRGFSDIVILDLITKILPENPKALLGDAAIPSVAKLMGTIASSPPASFSNYIDHVSNNMAHARLVQPAYAQSTGFGFSKLKAILPAWQGMRNLTYLIFVLVFVLYGFMLMFRVKIDPKLATSIELALPKIVVTLLAITFSYAIAGLLIDISILIPTMLVRALQTAKVLNLTLQVPIIDNILGFLGQGPLLGGLNDGNGPVNYITGQAWLGSFFLNFQLFFELLFSNGLSQIASLMFGLPAIVFDALFSWNVGLLVSLILILAFFYVLIKTAFMMLQSYAKIILNIIFAPVILLGNVLPGSDSLGSWMRNLIAELSIFPTVTIVTMFAISFLGNSSSIANADIWVPANWTGGGPLGYNNAQGAGALIAYAMIFLMPKIADMVRDALQIKPFKYGTAIGEGLMFGATAPLIGYSAGKSFTSGDYGTMANTLGGAFGLKLNLPPKQRQNPPGTPAMTP